MPADKLQILLIRTNSMKSLTNPRYIIAIFLFLVISSIYALYVRNSHRFEKNTIVLTKQGFSPAGLKIKKGTTVKFVSQLSADYWPASDPHPSHTIHPSFDPQRSIKPSQSWSFEFHELGTYRYHDHLNPIYKGTIVVVDENTPTVGQSSDFYLSLSECRDNTDQDTKRDCFTSILEEMVLAKGTDVTFNLVNRLRNEDPDFSAECHTIVHALGEISYWKYAQDHKLPQTGDISYCGFGYIHGFMQELGHHSKNFLKEASDLCDHFAKINYHGFEQTVDPLDQCYHGVGHGLAFYYVPLYWDSELDAISRGAEDCHKLSGVQTNVSNCIYGLFGGISSIYTGGHGYQLPINKDDPLWICKSQVDDLKEPCFDSMVSTLSVIFGKDLTRISLFFSGIEDKYLFQAYYSLGDLSSRWLALSEIKLGDVVSFCGRVSGAKRKGCVLGFAEGLIRNFYPQDAPHIALDFCRSKFLNKLEDNQCLVGLLSEMKLIYPDRIVEMLQKLSVTEYQNVCRSDALKKYCPS